MEIQRHALVKRDYLVPFVLVTSLFFLWGFAHAILDVLNKHFQEVMALEPMLSRNIIKLQITDNHILSKAQSKSKSF